MQIEFGGKKYSIRVTLGAQLLFKQETGKELSEMSGVEDFGKYLWCCARSASLADGTGFDIPFDTFVHRLDQEILDEWEMLQVEYLAKKKSKQRVTPDSNEMSQ